MQGLLRLLQFIRLLDEQGNISITNVAVMAAAAQLFMGDHVQGLVDLGPLALAVGNYAVKRYVTAGKTGQADQLAALLQGLTQAGTLVLPPPAMQGGPKPL